MPRKKTQPEDEPAEEQPADDRHELHAALQDADGPQPALTSRRSRRLKENQDG